MLRRVGLVATLVALVLPATAAARIYPLNWHEAFRYQNRVFVAFSVRTVSIGGGTWTVMGSVTNAAPAPLTLTRRHFGLRLYRTRYATPRTPNVFLPARRMAPAFPLALPPGQTWTGTFSGGGPIPHGRWIRVNFGTFAKIAPTLPTTWSWITDHTFRY